MPTPIVISILANASQAKAEIKDTVSTAQKVGTGFRRAALPATAALGVLAVGAKSAIDSASDLSETISKTGEVFGPQAKEIEKFAASAEQSLGQSKVAALDAASTFGIIGEKAGLSGKETAEFSKEFVTLASDLASFNNTSPEEAITAIGSAMRGEGEPIRKYGVLLDDATLRNRALKLGLIDSVKNALTPQQKALAASQEILAQTGKAQGDFARTADGAANKSRIQAAQIENVKAQIGEGLLPAYGKLLDVTSDVIEFAGEHEKETKILIGTIAGLAAGVLAVNAAMSVGKAGMAVYTAASKVLGKTNDETTRSLGRGRLAAGGAGAALLTLSASGKLGEGNLSKLATTAGAIATGYAVAGPFGAVVGGGLALLEVGKQSEESARLQEKFRKVQEQISAQAATLTSTLNEQTGAITANTREMVQKSLADNGAFTAADKVGVSYATVTKAALGNRSAQAQVTAATERYIRKQVEGVKGFDNQVSAMERVRTETEPLIGSVDKFSGSLGKSRTAAGQTRRAILQMSEQARDSATAMRGAGEDAGAGFAGGLTGWIGRIADIGAKLARTAAKAARDELKVKSPSRVFREIGEYGGQGLAEGFIASSPLAVDAVKNTIRATTSAARADLSNSRVLTGSGGGSVGSLYDRAPKVIRIDNLTVRLDGNMTEAEMGRSYKRAIAAAEQMGI